MSEVEHYPIKVMRGCCHNSNVILIYHEDIEKWYLGCSVCKEEIIDKYKLEMLDE